ncbi:MAG TPA: glycosyltransferase [Bacteroidales bacterium]|nr:glycosyltransferase [Bacteroidales bacterium]HPT53264.1 glycosyltransferase [Bacteroidales bacterium]
MINNEELHLSVIVPVYNRPDEIKELLESLSKQTHSDFEVLIIEDGSTLRCEEVCQQFSEQLDIHYYFKSNSGRSQTRNYGMERASGNYFIIFDSDCIMPRSYIELVKKHLTNHFVDCFGGPDGADSSFSDMQKAINYSMTSIMTTGGIRGATQNVNKFSPRSFNMGMSKEVFQKVGGYKDMIGEDIDLSIRIKQAGFTTQLFPEAQVFHKRRVNLKKFFKQVNTFGKARLLLKKLHPSSLKLVHLLPMSFVLGNCLLLLLAAIFCSLWFLLPIGIFILAIFMESLIKNKKISIAFLSIITSYTQLFGYGLGFISELITRKASRANQEELYKSH